MNYYSQINHRAFMEFHEITGRKIKIDDATILAWMYKYFLTDKCVKIIRDETLFMWVAYGHMIKQNPQLWITSTATLSRRMDKLIDAGFLLKHVENGHYGFRTFFSFTPLYNAIANREYKVGDIAEVMGKPHQNKELTMTKSSTRHDEIVNATMTETSTRHDETVNATMTKSSYNNNIIDTYINNNINDKEIRAFGFLIEKSVDRVFDWIGKNQRMIKNMDRLIESFDNKVDIEGLEYTPKKLIARLNNFSSSWIYNEQKNKSVETDPEFVPVYRRKISF